MNNNRVSLIGYLGKDAEIYDLNNGDKKVVISLATSESWKDRESGERKERTDWFRIQAFAKNVVALAQAGGLKKGDLVSLEAKLRTGSYDKNGHTVFFTDIVIGQNDGGLLKLRNGQNRRTEQTLQATGTDGAAGGHDNAPYGASPAGADLDDDIPF